MKKLELMIFDLDGTLIDSGKDLIDGVNGMLKSMGLQQKAAEEIKRYIGDGVVKLVERALGVPNLHRLEEALAVFSDYYGKHFLDNTVLCDGVEDVLRAFPKTPKVILTNKSSFFSLAIVRGLGIEKYFEEIIGADSMPFLKPDPRQIEYLLEKYRARRENTLMIGDGKNDILAAKNSGILSLALLNGLGDRRMLLELKADYYCETIREMVSLFEGR
jgi:phosphoglycolate phosphatase